MKTLTLLFLILLTSLTFAQNNALDFDGVDDYVNIPIAESDNTFSIEFWTKFDRDQDGYEGIIDKGRYSSPRQWSFQTSNSGKTVIFSVPTDASNGIEIYSGTDDQWHHFAGTYDGATAILYKDGVLVGSKTCTYTQSNNFEIVIGIVHNFTNCFDGKIDEVRIWDDVRTQIEIRENMYKELAGNETGLLGYYKLNETSGTNANDSQTNGSNNGTTVNTPMWVTSSAFFGPKNCLDLDGSNDLAEKNSPVTTVIDNFTMMTWVKADAILSSGNNILVYNGTDAGGYGIAIDNGHVAGLFGSIAWHKTTASLNTNKWYNIAMRRKNGITQFFLDGKLLSYSNTSAPQTPVNKFAIGNTYHTDGTIYTTSFDGQIDEVSVWDAALTDAQIRDVMCKSLVGDESNLVAYYNFDNSSGTKLQSFDGGGNGNDLTLVNMSDDDWVTSTAFNTWLNTNDATWSTTTNWSRGSVPSSTDNVGINSYSGGTDVSVSGNPVVNNFVVASSTTLSLSTGITVSGNLVLNSNLDPNGQGVSLSSTGTLIEGSGLFYGTSGYITTTRDLNNITAENVGGLGAVITTSANMGSTGITRKHIVQTNGSNSSIKRYYEITPTTNTGLDATLEFNYETDELNSLTEADLALFKSTDNGSTWTSAGGTVSTSNNTVTLSNISSFSRWSLFKSSATPVELVSFTYELQQSPENDISVLLKWETATEVNNYGFEVQRSAISGQISEKEWEVVGFVEGHGNSNSPKYYEYLDETPIVDSVEYRLKQIDTDGAYTYYAQRVKVSGYGVTDVEDRVIPKEYALEQNYPNPFNPSTTIKYSIPNVADTKFASTTNVTLKVYDILGREVATLVNKVQQPGNYSVNFDASDLASGTYIYRITASASTGSAKHFVSVKKFILMK